MRQHNSDVQATPLTPSAPGNMWEKGMQGISKVCFFCIFEIHTCLLYHQTLNCTAQLKQFRIREKVNLYNTTYKTLGVCFVVKSKFQNTMILEAVIVKV